MAELNKVIRVGGSLVIKLTQTEIDFLLSRVKIDHPGSHFSVDVPVEGDYYLWMNSGIVLVNEKFLTIQREEAKYNLTYVGLLWQLYNGVREQGSILQNKCGHPWCANPEHWTMEVPMIKPSSVPQPINGPSPYLPVPNTDAKQLVIDLPNGTKITIETP